MARNSNPSISYSSSAKKPIDLDDSYSESDDEYDREIYRLEREILEQKMEIVRREEMAKRNRILAVLQNEYQEPKKPILAELKSAKMMVENSQKSIAINRINTESISQTIATEHNAATSRHSRIISSRPKNPEQNYCIVL